MVCTIASNGSEFSAGSLNEHEEPISTIKAAVRNNIWKLCSKKGYDVFYSNTELGVPLWGGAVVTAISIYNPVMLKVAIPFEEQTTKWPEENREMYFSVHEKSVEAKIINTRYFSGCYEEADEYMIDRSDALLYFGNENDDCYILKYAKEKNKTIYIFNEEKLEIK